MQYEYFVAPFFDQLVQGEFTDESAQIGCRNLQNLLNQHAADGWEYYRSEQVIAHVEPRWFAPLVNRQATSQRYMLIVFRRPAGEPSR